MDIIPKRLKMKININFSPLYLEFESQKELHLSKIIPILNDIGLDIVSEKLQNNKIIFFIAEDCCLVNLKKHSKNVINIIQAVLENKTPTCPLLSLSLKQNFNLREINLLRTFMRYENQLILEFNIDSIIKALSKYDYLSKLFLDFFKTKFSGKDFKEEEIEDELKKVSSDEDKILKIFYQIIKNTTKTNYFLNKETISIKIETKELKPFLRGIQPNYEMFVFHKDFSGIHLRMSKIARGGLRYSSRKDDFRVEIKSLMATQEGKNAIIIPSGAKGGFIIRKENPTFEEFKEIYTSFIDAMLDLVDEDDNYFVVAADKGTSHMSDFANEVAKKKGFWMGDAFASGGSSGYSHKELGITARGALVSAERFFIEKGVDFEKDPIKVVGIGSMGGDVFGNALIAKENFLLVGAISHDEVFIDPNPNQKKSFEERKRLFYSKNHKWSDYDKSKISKGGGVFKRDDKEIELNPTLKKFLKTKKSVVSGEELIKLLLKLDVDMIYNGGVGTYIKASSETNLEVGDKQNEYVRVNANEVKAYCICEGGNLGLTQKARYEYALNGGKINLDSIDNAAGVNTSDHEVNLKIILKDHPKRDEILKKEQDFVVKSVLRDNFLQALAISIDAKRSKIHLKEFIKTVHVLENNLEVFKRRYFDLPNDKQFDMLLNEEAELIRPVLAELLLYSKIFLKNLLNQSDEFVSDPFFRKALFSYFSDEFLALFEEEILNFEFKKEMISMMIANKIINFAGSSFIADYHINSYDNFIKKIKAYLVLSQLLNIKEQREHIKEYEKLIHLDEELLTITRWMQKSFDEPKLVYDYKQNIDDFLEEREDFFEKLELTKYAILAVKLNKTTNISYEKCSQTIIEVVKKYEIELLMQKLTLLVLKDPTKELLKEQLENLLQNFLLNITISILLGKDIDKSFDFESYIDKIDELKKADSYSIYQVATLVNSLVLM